MKPQHVGCGTGAGDAALGLALQGGCVVCQGVQGTFSHIAGMGQNVVVGDGACQLQVRAGQLSRWVVLGHQGGGYVQGKGCLPEERCGGGGGCGEKNDTAHAAAGSVARNDQVGIGQDYLAQSGRLHGQGGHQVAHVVQEVVEGDGQGDALLVFVSQGFLHETEQPA